MKMKKMSNFTKSRKFYLLLCCVILFCVVMGIRVSNSAPLNGIAIRTFVNIDFPDNSQCWGINVGETHIMYTNSCAATVPVHVVVTEAGGTQETFLMAPNGSGRLLFLNGNGNVVHIFRE